MNDTKLNNVASKVIVAITWTFIASFLIWSLALIKTNIRDGGMGDESHRLLIAYRLTPDLSPTWELYLNQPWPPLPYILQVATHRAMRMMFGVTDRQFVQSALACTTSLFAIHLGIVTILCRRAGAPLAGLLYVTAILSSGTMVKLGVSAMAEGPTLFFMSLGCLLLTKPKIVYTLLAGGCFCAASLCRTEVALFSVCLSGLLLFTHGFLRATCFGAIATFATVLKTGITVFNQQSGMSYLNLKDFYWLGDSASERLGNLMAGFEYIRPINFFATTLFQFAFCLLALRGCLTIYGLIRGRTTFRAAFTENPLGIVVTTLGVAASLLIFTMHAMGLISWDTRYLMIPFCIVLLGSSVLACRSQASGPTIHPGVRLTFLFVLAAAIATVGGFGSRASYDVVYGAIPADHRQGRDVLLEQVSPDRRVVVDALMFWDVYPLMQAEICGEAGRGGSVYDHPTLAKTSGMEQAISNGESSKVVNLMAYTDQFEPGVYVSGGPATRKSLSQIGRFMDKAERSCYLYDSIEWTDETHGILSLSLVGSEKKFSVTKIYENDTIAVHDLKRLDSANESAAKVPLTGALQPSGRR